MEAEMKETMVSRASMEARLKEATVSNASMEAKLKESVIARVNAETRATEILERQKVSCSRVVARRGTERLLFENLNQELNSLSSLSRH